jgi:hypothetical protein
VLRPPLHSLTLRGIRVARTVPVSNSGNLKRKQRAAPVMLTRQRHPDELWSEGFKEVGRAPADPTTLLEDVTQPAVELLVKLRPSTLVLCPLGDPAPVQKA